MYKTRLDWVGKEIHWELCKRREFDHIDKWNVHNPKSALENKTYKILWDSDIQMDYTIQNRRADQIIIS